MLQFFGSFELNLASRTLFVRRVLWQNSGILPVQRIRRALCRHPWQLFLLKETEAVESDCFLRRQSSASEFS